MRRPLSLLAALLAATAVAACGGGAPAEPNESGALSLTLQQFPGALLYISDVVAQEEGIFERNGLDVEFVNPGDGATAMRLLASGDTHGLLADVASGLSAAAKGQPIGIAGSVINRSLFQISARTDLLGAGGDWRSRILALRGRTIGVPGIGSSGDYVLRGLLREAGLDPQNDVTVVSLATSQAAVAQFQQNALDAFINIAPAADVIEKAGVGGLYLDIATEAPEKFSASVIGMMTNRSFATENAEAVRRWVAAEEQAIEFIRDPANRAAAAGHIASSVTAGDTALAEKLVDYLANTAYADTRPGLAVPMDALQNQIALLAAGGVATDAIDVDRFVLAPGNN